MKLTVKNILYLPVYTTDETYLGKVFDIEINTETGEIITYYANKNPFLIFSSKPEYLISQKEIVSINKDKIIVKDTAIKKTILEKGELLIENQKNIGIVNSEIK